jgi:hypothetical protein
MIYLLTQFSQTSNTTDTTYPILTWNSYAPTIQMNGHLSLNTFSSVIPDNGLSTTGYFSSNVTMLSSYPRIEIRSSDLVFEICSLETRVPHLTRFSFEQGQGK